MSLAATLPRATPGTPPRWASLREFPPRPDQQSWPATEMDRASALAVLSAPPFVLDDPVAERRRAAAAGLLLDWLAGHPGQTLQQRWLPVEAGVAGQGWRQVLAGWLDGRGRRLSWHLDFLSVALRMAISADVVRPSLDWLLSGAMGRGALVRVFAATRDPGGFARLRAHCEREPAVPPHAVSRVLTAAR